MYGKSHNPHKNEKNEVRVRALVQTRCTFAAESVHANAGSTDGVRTVETSGMAEVQRGMIIPPDWTTATVGTTVSGARAVPSGGSPLANFKVSNLAKTLGKSPSNFACASLGWLRITLTQK